jgi:hypothetical protein
LEAQEKTPVQTIELSDEINQLQSFVNFFVPAPPPPGWEKWTAEQKYNGLRMAADDCMRMAEGWPEHVVREADTDLAAKGAITLSAMRSRRLLS